jgi:hypothetical protein
MSIFSVVDLNLATLHNTTDRFNGICMLYLLLRFDSLRYTPCEIVDTFARYALHVVAFIVFPAITSDPLTTLNLKLLERRLGRRF